MSTLPQKQATIKDKQYRLEALPAEVGLKAAHRLMRIAGSVYVASLNTKAAVVERNVGKSLKFKGELDKLTSVFGTAGGVQEFITRFTEDDLQYFRDIFIPRTEVKQDGEWKRAELDSFVCDYGALTLVLFEHVQFNFADYLNDAGSMIGSVEKSPKN